MFGQTELRRSPKNSASQRRKNAKSGSSAPAPVMAPAALMRRHAIANIWRSTMITMPLWPRCQSRGWTPPAIERMDAAGLLVAYARGLLENPTFDPDIRELPGPRR